MKLRAFLRLFGSLIKLLALLLLIPGVVSAYYNETQSVIAFALTSFLTLLIGIALGSSGSNEEIGHKEALALVSIGWLGVALFGALPYHFLGISLLDGLFESMSGFTTTGSTILTEMNAQGYWVINQTLAKESLAATLEWKINYAKDATALQPKQMQTYFGLLFWRSFSQWLGGMGIILLFIAILPRLGVAGRQLYRAEVPGPDKESLMPHIQQMAQILWWVYILMTVSEIFLLVAAGMPLYDSLCNAFATTATGGFSPKGLSIMAYHSGYIDSIITVFMFLAGANFVLHYKTLYSSNRTSLIRDPEFRLYASIVLVSVVILVLWGGMNQDPLTSTQIGQNMFQKIRIASFQTVSIMTTTGFSTADFDKWSSVSKYLLLLLMFIGACAGSTCGAIKVVRILLVTKSGYNELFYALHPKAVRSVKLGKTPIKAEILHSSNVFVALYVFIFAIFSLILGVICSNDPRMDVLAITSAVATTLGNCGPGFGIVGPYYSFAEIPSLGKILLFFCMWIGRLEIVTALTLFVPEFWKE